VQPKADSDHWKKKYFDSLRSLEQEERGFRSLESQLRRIVNRLCFAALGQTAELDAEVRRLTEAMRKKADETELERLFTPLSDAITALDSRQAAQAVNASPTVVPVAPTIPASPPVLTEVARLPAGAVRVAVDLDGAGVAAMLSDSASRPAFVAATTAATGPADADAVLHADERVRLLLTRILAEMRRDTRLAPRATQFEERLAQPLTEGQLPVILSGIADLVAERISWIEQEKAEVERLLSQISLRLDELTSYVVGEEQDRKISLENTQELNSRLTQEMKALGSSVDTTVDIVQLKMNVRTRLDSIGSHLQDFREREEGRARHQWERSEKMRERLERLERESRELQERLRDEQRLSLIDPLTQIPNRMAYDQRLEEEYARWTRTQQPLCIAAWDIDHFKRINDAYGHRAGDKVLRIVAETLAERLRKSDFLGRYGGEEFVMILPETDGPGSLHVANKMRDAVAALGFHFRGQPVSVTISCGLTVLTPGDSADEAFERADKALYRAKEAGRNCCVLS
jgi:diguanylate cyclase